MSTNTDYLNFVSRMGSFDGELDESLSDTSLSHHGVMGMKWGVRRFQNLDGSLTKAGSAKLDRLGKSNTARAKKQVAQTKSKWDTETLGKKLYSQASTKDKLLYGRTAYQKAAKKINKHKLSEIDAIKSAKGEMWTRTAVITAISVSSAVMKKSMSR